MKPENRKFLDDNRHFHTTLVQAQYLKGLNGNERSGMLNVMREEFQPGYTTDLWCPTCVADFVLALYRYYDDFLTAEANRKQILIDLMNTNTAVIEVAPEGVKAIPVTEPVTIPEIIENVKASFPSNEPRSNTNTFNPGAIEEYNTNKEKELKRNKKHQRK